MHNKTSYVKLITIAMILTLLVACSTPANSAAVPAAAINTAASDLAAAGEEAEPVVQTVTEIEVSDVPVETMMVESDPLVLEAPVPQHTALVAAGEISESDAAAVAFMREEEKLARDVYLVLADEWGLPVFSNIAASEQTHMDSVLSLIERYALPDPAAGNEMGVFTDAALQTLYDSLVAEGKTTLLDGLRVAAAIEEIDILDLDARLANTTDANVIAVFANLRAGSENHLRAFVGNLERQAGVTYQPQYLTQEMYAAILMGENGRNGAQNGNGGVDTGEGNGIQGRQPDKGNPAGEGAGNENNAGASQGGGRGYRGGRGG